MFKKRQEISKTEREVVQMPDIIRYICTIWSYVQRSNNNKGISVKKTTGAMQQMQKGLEIRIGQRVSFPRTRDMLDGGIGTTGCKCRSSLGDHGIIGKVVEAV